MDGCEQSAEAAVTRGCLRERERSREAERLRFATADADADRALGRISHFGSCESICAFHDLASIGAARHTTIVIDSLSEESKLSIDVGVRAGCCGVRLGDSAYCRVTLVDGGLVLLSVAVLKV